MDVLVLDEKELISLKLKLVSLQIILPSKKARHW